MQRFCGSVILFLVLLQTAGCGKAWQMDYSAPAAQFNEDKLLEKGKPFIGQKITVKGVVTRQDLSDSNNCKDPKW